MLATLSTSVSLVLGVYLGITASFFFFIRSNLFVFARIWLVFAFFFAQLLLLGFFGEDFFIAFALAAELPVFFGFFFFYVAKANVRGLSGGAKQKIFVRWVYFLLPLGCFLIFIKKLFAHPTFDYYAVAFQDTARSDFFLLYFTYYVTAPQLIILIGALIVVVTFILVVLSFKNQITGLGNLKNTSSLAWTKTQSGFVQTGQKNSSIFFRL